ncbi:zinc finger protein OZF-like [Zerene cesonia]|uniref:zinc finger protein OZF-like n=1 Tax=Zerene cesonia TaxID=33412 RepID=UPI0018E505EE|nr:zinc finger protein OZF-like [Zerene cesonia]
MNICRTCLAIETSKNIYDLPKGVQEESKSHTEIMQFCVDIEIVPDQKISTKLCETCFLKIVDIYKFKEQAIKNDKYLQTHSSYIGTNNCLVGDTPFKQCDDDYNDNFIYDGSQIEIKDEVDVKEESESGDYKSDDELLSTIKNIKYGYVTEDVKENLPTIQAKNKKGREKIKDKKNKEAQICEECGKTVRNIKAHMTLHQPKCAQKNYQCEYCDKVFKSYGARYKHVKIKHFGVKEHCYLCNKKVVNLKSHTLNMHDTSSLPFECNICSRRFISPSRLKEHTLIHTKEKPFMCDMCNKGFRNSRLMMVHKRQVHDKEKHHLCQFCSKSFFKKYALQIHLRSHSKEKPYECKICGKWYSCSTVLKNHALLHEGDKKFSCKYCDMTFASAKYVYKHMVVHTKEKKYPCKYCGVRFGRSDHRLRHEKTAHERHFTSST